MRVSAKPRGYLIGNIGPKKALIRRVLFPSRIVVCLQPWPRRPIRRHTRQESGEKLHAGLNIRDRCDVTLPGRRSSPRPVSSGGVVPAMVPLPDGTLFRHKRISVRRDGAGTTHFAMLDSLVKIKPPPVTGAV